MYNKASNSRNYAIKGIIVALLILLMLIPTVFISDLVNERKSRQIEAIDEISDKWANSQTITGPILTIPYYELYKSKDSTFKKTKKYINILPQNLNINGKLIPEKRYRGIYEVVVYSSKLNISGDFSKLVIPDKNILVENILFDEAVLSMGISDLRGIEENVSINFNQQQYAFNAGIANGFLFKSGINTAVKIDSLIAEKEQVGFSLGLNLKGSQFLHFTPIGKETSVNLESEWQNPSFEGAFLPDKRIIDEKGFQAEWKILQLNRNYPQSWINDDFDVNDSNFGINLRLPLDNYSKTERSVKYAILFIALTFVTFYFLEILNKMTINPLQYLLIGFALCIFYTLLLSISEYLIYSLAYLIASSLTIGLIAWYAKSILESNRLASLVGSNLLLLYGFIFTIIQVEDSALLIGSIGLFIILAFIMYFSKKIDWASLNKEE